MPAGDSVATDTVARGRFLEQRDRVDAIGDVEGPALALRVGDGHALLRAGEALRAAHGAGRDGRPPEDGRLLLAEHRPGGLVRGEEQVAGRREHEREADEGQRALPFLLLLGLATEASQSRDRDGDLGLVDAEHRVRRERRLHERDVVDRRRGLEVQRLREDARRAELDEEVLDGRLIERQADLAARAAADEHALGLDVELLDLPGGESDLEA